MMADNTSIYQVLNKYASDNDIKVLAVCFTGSHVYGLETAESDADIIVIYLEAPRKIYALNPTKSTLPSVKIDGYDITFWRVDKFFSLLLNSNFQAVQMYLGNDVATIPLSMNIRRTNRLNFNHYTILKHLQGVLWSDCPLHQKAMYYLVYIYILQNNELPQTYNYEWLLENTILMEDARNYCKIIFQNKLNGIKTKGIFGLDIPQPSNPEIYYTDTSNNYKFFNQWWLLLLENYYTL